jgi:hypothetical protein
MTLLRRPDWYPNTHAVFTLPLQGMPQGFFLTAKTVMENSYVWLQAMI